MVQGPAPDQTPSSWEAWLNQLENPSPAAETTLSPPVTQASPHWSASSPTVQAEIDTLSQALRRQDQEAIHHLIQTIERNHSEPEVIEILLAATVNLCR